jgi:quercetin dioxygenase-like cupin family protein
MPIIRNSEIKRTEVFMEGVAKTTRANVIGVNQGWKDYALRVFRIAPQGYTPHHQHDWEHVNYIISGKGTLTIGEDTREIAAGDFAYVPPNLKHQFRNPFEQDFEFICIVPSRGAY